MFEDIYEKENIINNVVNILNGSTAYDKVHKVNDDTVVADYKDYDRMGNDVRVMVRVDDDNMIYIEAPKDIVSNIASLISSRIPSYSRFIE